MSQIIYTEYSLSCHPEMKTAQAREARAVKVGLAAPATAQIVHCLLRLRLVEIVFTKQNRATDFRYGIVKVELFVQLRNAAVNHPVRFYF